MNILNTCYIKDVYKFTSLFIFTPEGHEPM